MRNPSRRTPPSSRPAPLLTHTSRATGPPSARSAPTHRSPTSNTKPGSANSTPPRSTRPASTRPATASRYGSSKLHTRPLTTAHARPCTASIGTTSSTPAPSKGSPENSLAADDGHTPPDDAAGGAWTCDRFDEQPPATSAPPVVPPPPPPTGGVTTGLDSVNCTYDGIPLWGNVYVVSTPIAADVTAFETSLSTDGVLRGLRSCPPGSRHLVRTVVRRPTARSR